MCRNNHHNKYNGYKNALMRHVNNKLRKNRKILFELNKSNRSHLSIEELTILGFEWQYFTEEIKNKTGNVRFCYDYGILPTDGENVNIVLKPYEGRHKKYLPAMAAEEQNQYA